MYSDKTPETPQNKNRMFARHIVNRTWGYLMGPALTRSRGLLVERCLADASRIEWK